MDRPALRILGLDAACGIGSAAVLEGETLLAEAEQAQGADALASLAAAVLQQAGVTATGLDAVAVTVGPGRFTGLRAALALAHGIAAGAGLRLVPVTVTEALALPLRIGRRALWVAIDSRRGRVFLDRGLGPEAVALPDLPSAPAPVALAGDAAVSVAAWLAAAGADVMLTDVRRPQARHVAAVAARRIGECLPDRPALPLYVDPPEARLPAGGLRPAPA